MELTPAMLRCMHRPPTLKQPTKANENHSHTAQVSDAQQRQRPKALASGDEGKAQGSRPPAVCFTLRRVQLLDVDAKWASVKDLLDGLQYAGLIPGDKEGEISLEVRQEKVRTKDEEGTVIEIENTAL